MGGEGLPEHGLADAGSGAHDVQLSGDESAEVLVEVRPRECWAACAALVDQLDHFGPHVGDGRARLLLRRRLNLVEELLRPGQDHVGGAVAFGGVLPDLQRRGGEAPKGRLLPDHAGVVGGVPRDGGRRHQLGEERHAAHLVELSAFRQLVGDRDRVGRDVPGA